MPDVIPAPQPGRVQGRNNDIKRLEAPPNGGEIA
jgi:hypothetical protein